MNFNLIDSDPSVWGPGVWMTLHILGFHSNTQDKFKSFIETLNIIISNLPCSKCRDHAMLFIKNTNYNSYLNMRAPNGKLLGPFRYICDMHNNANVLLNKSKVSWVDAYKEYERITENGCDGPCTSSNHSTIQSTNRLDNKKENILKYIDDKDFEIVFTKTEKTHNKNRRKNKLSFVSQ